MEEQKLFEILKSPISKDYDLAIKFLYEKYYPFIRGFITKNHGSNEDAKDIFQDSLIILLSNLKKNDFHLTCKLRTYIYSISRNLWYKKFRTENKNIQFVDTYDNVLIEDSPLMKWIQYEKNEILSKLIEQLPQNCRKILLYFYYDNMPLRDIAQIMDFSSEQVAKNKKFHCMKKLKEMAKKRLLSED